MSDPARLDALAETALYQAAEGIRFVIGRLDGQSTTTVQTVLFDKERWTAERAREWLGNHDMRSDKLDETSGSLRFRQRDPGDFEAGSLRTISPGQRDAALEEGATLTYADLNGVEIFRVGKWNGDKYERKDLDDMVDAFDRVGFRPPVKLGHKESSGDPAFGWVKALRRVGDVLLADLMDIPKKVADMIKARQFDAVSSEIFWNLERGGEKFRRALKAVALLGAETPAVAGLKPLRDSFDLDDADFDSIHAYDIKRSSLMSDGNDGPDPGREDLQQQIDERDEKIAELTAKLNKKAEGDDDDLALTVKRLAEDNDALKRRIAQQEEQERQISLDRKVNAIKLPALRDHFRSLYEMESRSDVKTVSFTSTVDGERKTSETAPIRVIDDLAKRIERIGENLMHNYAIGNDRAGDFTGAHQDPGAELTRLAKAYQAEHKVEFDEAFRVVLDDPQNADLKADYAKS